VTDLFDRRQFIKICGVTTPGDARMIQDAQATALGIIFAPSKRQVSVEVAIEIARSVTGIGVVGVFRDDESDFIRRVVDLVPLDAVQIHGALDDGLRRDLRERGLGVIQALSVGDGSIPSFDDTLVDAVLVDGPSPGSGATHSWDELTARSFDVPVIVAGGLTASTVHDVQMLTGAWGVDVATGVESAPGVKDRQSVLNFVSAALRAEDRGDRHGE